MEEEVEEDDLEKKGIINKNTLAKLQSLIDQDKEKEEYKSINKSEENEQNNSVKLNDNFEDKTVLVNRPLKNFVWGLGLQTRQKKCKKIFIIDVIFYNIKFLINYFYYYSQIYSWRISIC